MHRQQRSRDLNHVPDRTRVVTLCVLVMFFALLAVVVFLPEEGNQTLQLVGRLARVAEQLGLPYRASFNLIEFSLNIALFLPFGLLFPLAVGSLHPGILGGTVVIGAVGSATIEWAQLFIPGRITAGSDVIANTLGTVFGVLLLLLWRQTRYRKL